MILRRDHTSEHNEKYIIYHFIVEIRVQRTCIVLFDSFTHIYSADDSCSHKHSNFEQHIHTIIYTIYLPITRKTALFDWCTWFWFLRCTTVPYNGRFVFQFIIRNANISQVFAPVGKVCILHTSKACSHTRSTAVLFLVVVRDSKGSCVIVYLSVNISMYVKK